MTVDSTWIESLSRDSLSGNVEMTLKNGNTYRIENMSQDDFQSWADADSQGSHFNNSVRPSATITKA